MTKFCLTQRNPAPFGSFSFLPQVSLNAIIQAGEQLKMFTNPKEGRMTLGGWEWLIILVIVIIVFGVGKLPQVGGAIGKSIREFREASASPEQQEPDKTSD